MIGAGPGGLATAMYLKERGVEHVTVLERLDRIGGKCCTVTIDDKPFDMGANYLTPGYRRTLQLAKELGCTTHAAPRRKAFDVATGAWHSLIMAVLSGENPFAFLFAVLKYIFKSWRLRKFSAAPGFDGVGAMPDLHKSFGQWLDDNGLSSLRRLFAVPIEIFGYGYLDEVPVPYVLKYMTTLNFLVVLAVGSGLPIRWPKQFDQGYGGFWQKVVDAKGIHVHTEVTIESIDRSGPVTVTTSDRTFTFDELVIACPPADILRLASDRTQEEEELFAAVRHRDYWVTATQPRGVPDNLIDEIQQAPAPTLPPKGHPWGMSKMYTDSNVVLYYTLVDGELDEHQVDERIRADTEEMDATAGLEVLQREKWNPYFPHLAPEDFAAQWYERAEAMQGRRHTWYSGGLFAFELVEPILGYAHHLAGCIVHHIGQPRIAVVGAGAGGLSAAWYLKARGYDDVTVLEKEGRAGGKCESLDLGGRPIDIGAFTVSPAYKETMKIASQVGAPLIVQQPRLAWVGRGKIEPIRKVVLRDAGLFGLAWAALRYVFALWRLRSVLGPPGFGPLAASPYRDELCDSFETWLRTHRLTALEDMFEMVVPDMGYGRLGSVPAVYVLKYIGCGNFVTLSLVGLGLTRSWPKRFVDGFGGMWAKVANTVDVQTGVKITNIERSDDGVLIWVEDEPHVRAFDRLVIACPINQVFDCLTDPTPDEKFLAGNIKYQDYRVYVAITEGVPFQIIDAVHELRAHRPWEILKSWPDVDGTVFYVASPGHEHEEKIEHHLRRSLEESYPDSRMGALLFERKWDYFPHYQDPQLRDGAYTRFEEIQGLNRTAYVGGHLAFETVETTVAYSKATIEAHFPDLTASRPA